MCFLDTTSQKIEIAKILLKTKWYLLASSNIYICLELISLIQLFSKMKD